MYMKWVGKGVASHVKLVYGLKEEQAAKQEEVSISKMDKEVSQIATMLRK